MSSRRWLLGLPAAVALWSCPAHAKPEEATPGEDRGFFRLVGGADFTVTRGVGVTGNDSGREDMHGFGGGRVAAGGLFRPGRSRVSVGIRPTYELSLVSRTYAGTSEPGVALHAVDVPLRLAIDLYESAHKAFRLDLGVGYSWSWYVSRGSESTATSGGPAFDAALEWVFRVSRRFSLGPRLTGSFSTGTLRAPGDAGGEIFRSGVFLGAASEWYYEPL